LAQFAEMAIINGRSQVAHFAETTPINSNSQVAHFMPEWQFLYKKQTRKKH